MPEPSTGTMHGMVGGEARDTTERCVCGVCTRETQERRTERERECQRLQNRRFTLVIFPYVFVPTRKNHASVMQGPRPKGDHPRKTKATANARHEGNKYPRSAEPPSPDRRTAAQGTNVSTSPHEQIHVGRVGRHIFPASLFPRKRDRPQNLGHM